MLNANYTNFSLTKSNYYYKAINMLHKLKHQNTKRKINKMKKTNKDKKYYIYELVNDVNSKKYIGQTSDPEHRFSLCQYRAKKIKDAIKKIGWDKFHANLLEVVYTKEDADKMELHYIEKFDTVNNGYNSTYGTTYVGNKKRSAKATAKQRATMSTSKWYFNPKTEETVRIMKDAPVPAGFVPGRGGQKKAVRTHVLWAKIKKETPIAEIA